MQLNEASALPNPCCLKWHQYLQGAVMSQWRSSQFRTSLILYWASFQRSCSGCNKSFHIIRSLILSNPPLLMFLHCANHIWANQKKEMFCSWKIQHKVVFLSSQLQLIIMVCLMCLMSLMKTNMCSLWTLAGCRLEAGLDDIIRR